MLAAQDKKYGWPEGLAKALWMQETGGRREFIDNPAKYHYEKNAEGKRIAPHTGKVSTAFGPFGILESTARDPGHGVTPLRDKSLKEQVRFAYELLAAYERDTGSLASGLAKFGEGAPYARKIENRLNAPAAARSFSRGASVTGGAPQVGASVRNETKVDIHELNVHTTAATLPAITTEALGTAMDKSANMLNQTASGL